MSDPIAENATRQLEATRRVMAKAINVFVSRNTVQIKMVPHLKSAGATDGHDIFWGGPLTQGLSELLLANEKTTDFMAAVVGMNYHEMSHLLWSGNILTQRSECERIMKARKAQVSYEMVHLAFNVLDDARIEALTLGLYPSMKTYFLSMLPTFVFKGDGDPLMGYLLSYGRKYLPADMRAGFRAIAEASGVKHLDEMGAVIDAFMTTQLDDLQRRAGLAIDLVQLIVQNAPADQQGALGKAQEQGSTGDTQPSGKGSPPSTVSEEDKDRAQKAVAESVKGDQIDSAKPAQYGSMTEAVKDLQAEADAELEADESAQADISDIQQSIRNEAKTLQRGTGDAPADQHKLTPRPVMDTDHLLVANLKRTVRTATARLAPHWEQRTNRGAVDTVAFKTRKPHESNVFRAWNPGKLDQATFEAVVLVDLSGSMQYQLARVGRMAWALKKAYGESGARVTVIGFSNANKHFTIYSGNERAETNAYRHANEELATFPASAIAQANHILTASKAKHRFMFTLTDGSWGGMHDGGTCPISDAAVAEMTRRGIHTVLTTIGSRSFGAHNHEVSVQIDDSEEGIQGWPRVMESHIVHALRTVR